MKTGGTVHACGGKCTHYGAPLKDGVLLGHVLTCPWHNARFDVSTGKAEAPPALEHLPQLRDEGRRRARFSYGRRVRERRPPGSRPRDLRQKGDLVIVGAGAAGNAAALTLRRGGYEGQAHHGSPRNRSFPTTDRTSLRTFSRERLRREWMSLGTPDLYKNLQIEIWTEPQGDQPRRTEQDRLVRPREPDRLRQGPSRDGGDPEEPRHPGDRIARFLPPAEFFRCRGHPEEPGGRRRGGRDRLEFHRFGGRGVA